MNNSSENKTDQQSAPDILSGTCRTIDKTAYAAAVLGIIAAVSQKVDQNIDINLKNEDEIFVLADERDPRCEDDTLFYVKTEVDKMADAIMEMDPNPSTVETPRARKKTYDLDFNIRSSSYSATLVDVDCRKEHADKCYTGGHPFHEYAEYLRFHNKTNNKALRYMLFANGIGIWLENKVQAEPWAFASELDYREVHRCAFNGKPNIIPPLPLSVLLGFDFDPEPRYMQPVSKDYYLYSDSGFNSFTRYPLSPRCSIDVDKNKDYLPQTTEKFFKGVGHAYLAWKKRKAEEKTRIEQQNKEYAEDI